MLKVAVISGAGKEVAHATFFPHAGGFRAALKWAARHSHLGSVRYSRT